MSRIYWTNISKLLLLLLIFTTLVYCGTTPGTQHNTLPPALSTPTQFKSIYRAYKSTVSVINDKGKPSCAGVIIQNKKNQYLFVLTAYHCVDSQTQIQIGSIRNNWNFTMALVGSDKKKDLALLRSKILMKQDGTFAELAKQEPMLASTVFLVGNPNGKEHNITKGIISNSMQHQGKQTYRTDADLWYGNSGGGMFNAQGELVGIVVQVEPTIPHISVVTGGGHATALPEIKEFLAKHNWK